MAKEKRTKPCSNCKKSKVKCIYSKTLPCERCVKSGQAANCQFVPKLPSLKLPQITPLNNTVRGKNDSEITLPPLNPIANVQTNQVNRMQTYMVHSVPQQGVPVVPGPTGGVAPLDNESQWKQLIENRISVFDNKLNDLVDILKTNQKVLLEQQMAYQKQIPHQQTPPQQSALQNGEYNYNSLPASMSNSPRNSHKTIDEPLHYNNYRDYRGDDEHDRRRRYIGDEPSKLDSRKRHKGNERIGKENQSRPEDFRDGFLNIHQARELFSFFDTHISPQLFGFEISKFAVDAIWESSPILICAICTIASMHHPNEELSGKLKELHGYLHVLCGKLLYQGKPKNEVDGFNTIVALILCSFWLSDSQMFTGLALQLAKEIGLDSPVPNHELKGSLNEKDRIKLWYLLYVLDGQQSLTFNRQPLVNSQEYSLKHSRSILLQERNLALLSSVSQIEDKNESSVVQKQKETKMIPDDAYIQEAAHRQRFTDMRLVSQVEYNQALNEAFQGNAWELLAPSALGIPSKSNLELDKWMVSWTVLLSPVSNGSVWSSKSTLIYYNFAKMYINSSAVRQLQVDTADERSMFPKWNLSIKPQAPKQKRIVSNDVDSEDDSDDEEFISNRDHISDDETIVSASIAINAAQTVLNLVLNDNDILNNLKYVPVHIHIMLYYAALLLVNPPLEADRDTVDSKLEDYFNKVISNLGVVKNLHKKIYTNLPTDKIFGNRLMRSLSEIVEENASKIRNELNTTNDISENIKDVFRKKLRAIEDLEISSSIVELIESEYGSNSSGSATPGPERIFAWPGSNHGHP
ncbi:uncharacterized protein AC631_05397 [Debaryomyces fabryi]|uniref:Zn(2)-C6 fungal-type domain-containing protein n=1 Tax=Debaryomyces fabryi TaxID=58627 RepID=A0A0V1PRJ6_9ASCO|nr:uncharacterized protein AC631_05397 [Debaryomyces fabryi]KRZ98848.1 hypothetical protein AC631_05397 [Debaryomyces fabryi]CUM48646.1 unnamed protein product [Debaryomyces fabryi]